jgi:uncharacterized protein (DUF427 family)
MAVHLEDVTIGRALLTVPSPEARFRLEPSPRHVRVVFGGETIADSDHVLLLLEHRRLPVFYFPLKDVHSGALERTDHATESDLKGTATYWTVRAGDRVAENAAWSYDAPPPDGPNLKGHVAFYWNEMDAWYEEEEPFSSQYAPMLRSSVRPPDSGRWIASDARGICPLL